MSTDLPFEAPWAWHRHRHGPTGRAEQRDDRPDDSGGRSRGRGRGRRHGGPFGPFNPGFGPGGFGPGGFGPRGGRARRGDVRAAILSLLNEEPMHGYQLIQEIAARSDGVWRPSAGSVYPALSQLEDEGLVRPDVRADEDGSRKVFTLTDLGRTYVAEHATELADPWDAVTGGVSDAMAGLMGLAKEVHMASIQVLRTGDPQQVQKAQAVLADARRSLYLVLAGEPTDDAGEA
jgi:DNA-binding PadR family transcriptional regulator